MRVVPASKAKNRFGSILAMAQTEPIVIRRHGREVAVVVSLSYFKNIRRSMVRSFVKSQRALAQEGRRNGLTVKRLKNLLTR